MRLVNESEIEDVKLLNGIDERKADLLREYGESLQNAMDIATVVSFLTQWGFSGPLVRIAEAGLAAEKAVQESIQEDLRFFAAIRKKIVDKN